MVDLIIDGYIYQYNSFGGNLRIYNEILPRMCEIDKELSVTIATTGSCSSTLPHGNRISHKKILPIERYLKPSQILWPMKPIIRSLLMQIQIGRGKGKIWHSTYYTLPLVWNGHIAVTVLDLIYHLFPEYYNKPGDQMVRDQIRKSLLAADVIFSISRTTAQDLVRIFKVPNEKIIITPLASSKKFCILPSDFLEQCSVPFKPYLLYVGRRSHYKNFMGLLRSYRLWNNRYNVNLVVVGPLWTEIEKRFIEDNNLKHKVHLLTNINDRCLNVLYNQADAFIYPSIYEGFGIPLLEAMSTGCPIIASCIPSTIEVAGDCPIYFDVGEPDSLICAFEKMVLEGRQSEHVRKGLEKVQLYSWEKTASLILDGYRSLDN
ncbi:MAG: glycosyltransferase family 4 protein [Candidatus Atribacteria bacterium]|nr:glycosyltransferase family 4 protein [Candidatus Atribacteria bacterium]